MTDFEAGRLISAARHAAVPGYSRRKKAQKEYEQEDSPERISKCLTCRFSDCVNCYTDKRNAFEVLFKSGMNRASICNALSIGKQTFFNYKKQIAKGA